MPRLSLPSVTLLCADCVDVSRAIAVVKHCKTLADFGAVKVLSNQQRNYPIIPIDPLTSLVMYSVWMLTECHKYIDTDHVLVVQRDGWILNPDKWEDDWLQYDYLAPVFNQYDIVGSGGFSMRSKRLMQAVAAMFPAWDGTEATAEQIQRQAGLYEDGVIAFSDDLRSRFNFAPVIVGNRFAQGGNLNPANHNPQPFGFHGSGRMIDFATGTVEPATPDGTESGLVLNRELTRLMELYNSK